MRRRARLLIGLAFATAVILAGVIYLAWPRPPDSEYTFEFTKLAVPKPQVVVRRGGSRGNPWLRITECVFKRPYDDMKKVLWEELSRKGWLVKDSSQGCQRYGRLDNSERMAWIELLGSNTGCQVTMYIEEPPEAQKELDKRESMGIQPTP